MANIKGDIHAGEVHIYGRVEGNIESNRCHLNAQSNVSGDITTGTLSMDEGARLSGRAQIG
jgi:cytoskeletal protein CcmA (bactofilin family)